jgi:hypothetical protein
MPVTPNRRRSINMPEVRSKQIALAAAYLGTDGETIIQSAVTALLLSLAGADASFAAMLARTQGLSWDELVKADRTDILAKLMT